MLMKVVFVFFAMLQLILAMIVPRLLCLCC